MRPRARPNPAYRSMAKWIDSMFSKNYLMLTAVFGAGFAFEIGYNRTMNSIWDNMNKGRQWKDIRNKYIEGGDEE
ncbi:hypothetical protein BROUX41_005236 [Berkeleyomyces rouxiae]